MSTTATHTVANRREHPRILVLEDGADFSNRLLNSVNMPGTVRAINDVGEVDQNEWDALFLTEEYLHSTFNVNTGVTYTRTIAEHLYVFLAVPPSDYVGRQSVLDLVKGHNEKSRTTILQLKWGIPGHEIRVQQGFDRELRDSLVQTVESRTTQAGLATPQELPDGVTLDSFAIGPGNLILAGSLTVPGRGEVWFVPSEVSDLAPWVNAAFKSWRRSDPKRFPGVPDWWASPDWYSAKESAIAEEVASETAEFEAAKTKFDEAIKTLQAKLDTARDEATDGARQLLRGQDDTLQDAVHVALVALGFEVRDMDLEWDEKERREDFRITDPDSLEWLVIGDATGVRGNAKGNKIAVLQGYVTKYVYEEKPASIPGMWYLLNREIDKDPNTRSTILRSDEIEPFAAAKGLILDTTALYVLARHAIANTNDKPAIREYLRTSTGLITLEQARAWLATRSDSNIALSTN